MSLTQVAIDNLPQSHLNALSEKFGLSETALSGAMGVLASAALSAVKAGVVRRSTQGEAVSLTSVFADFGEGAAASPLGDLLGGNQQASDLLKSKVADAAGVSEGDAGALIQEAAPSLMNSLKEALQNLPQLLSGDTVGSAFAGTGYEGALNAANNFLQSVFGEKAAAESGAVNTPGGGGVFQSLLDVIDADNDGSVTDDIFNMLVK